MCRYNSRRQHWVALLWVLFRPAGGRCFRASERQFGKGDGGGVVDKATKVMARMDDWRKGRTETELREELGEDGYSVFI